MAESAAAKSMEQMEELKRILMQFNQTGGVQVINMVQDSLKIMDAQHQVLFQELQDVKAQLSAMQESMTKQNQKDLPLAKKIVTGLESRISEIGNYVSGLKRGIGEKVSNVLKDFKAHGIIALNNIADKLGIKDLFKSVEKFFNKKVGEIQKSLDTLNTISHEVNEVKTHKQNIYRALKGQEFIEVPAKQGKVFALLSNLLNKCLQVCVNCSSKAHDLAVKLEKLEVKALDAGDSLKKNSVLNKLDQDDRKEVSIMHQAENIIDQLEEKKTIFSPQEKDLIVNYAFQSNDIDKTRVLAENIYFQKDSGNFEAAFNMAEAAQAEIYAMNEGLLDAQLAAEKEMLEMLAETEKKESVSGKLNRFKQEIAAKDDKQNAETNRENMSNVPQLEDKQKKHEERAER